MPFLKDSLSWSVIVLGIIVGTFGLAIVANIPVFPGYFEPDWSRVVGTALTGLIVLLASAIAIGNRRWAGLLLLTVPLIELCLALWRRINLLGGFVSLGEFVLVFAGISMFFILPGTFWLLTSRAGWPQLISPRLIPGTRIHWATFIGSFLFVTCVVIGVLASFYSPPYGLVESCNQVLPPVSAQRFPGQVVFTAKVIAVGRPVDGSPSPLASWSVVRVQRRVWGLPAWTPDFVIARYYFRKGERGEYFVDGQRSQGLLTHFLPIVEGYPCCHTQHLDRAIVDLRVLKDGPPKLGVRIIGRVDTDMYVTSEPARGVRLLITGPDGTITVTTDQQGIYDLIGLPAGHYSVQVESESQRRSFSRAEGDVKSGEVWGANLIAYHAQPSVH